MQGIVPSFDPTLESVRANHEVVLKAMEEN